VLLLSTQFRAVIKHWEHVYTKCECPTGDVAKVSRGLAVKFAGQPRGVFAESGCKAGDAFLCAMEFL
jgi:hypothetical protein